MKKIIASIVAAFLIFVIFGAIPLTNAASDPFSDVKSTNLNIDAISYLKNNKVISGYSDGTYLPDTTINRAEFLKIIVSSIESNPAGSNCFIDIKTDWYAKYVCYAKTKGIIQGYADGSFKPDQNISLVEASKIIVKAFNMNMPQASAKVWYEPYVKTLETQAAIPVTIDYADKKLSRAEMAEMIWRIKTANTTKVTKTFDSLSAELPTISSCGELKEKMISYNNRKSNERMMIEEMAMPTTASPTSGGTEKVEYSTTNVQVEGVDEADVIKNDDAYIYMIKGDYSNKSVYIIKAYPPEEMSSAKKIEFDDSEFHPSELYAADNKLVVIGSVYSDGKHSKIYIYNITDRTNPVFERSLDFEGNYVSSRKIGNYVYLITNNYPRYYILENGGSAEDILPKYSDSKTGKAEPVSGCVIPFDPYYSEPNFLVIAGISLETGENDVNKQVIMGGGQNVYASTDNLYIATTHYKYNELVPYDIWEPPVTDQSTVLYKFQLKDGKVEYKGDGEVPGEVLNQFSMDEYKDSFRIATTHGTVWEGHSDNNLYILDKNNLKTVVGKIEGFAKGEKIYSARFLGDRAYLVTFKKVDPFFVIDVSNPADPKILGELKIPGYSDYLHPFDENHVIGFGKDTVEATAEEMASWGRDFQFAWYQGMKIALFDVTDVANPQVMFKEVIGDRGTDSELLHNHKALLYDKTRNLFAFPITVAEVEDKTGPANTYGETVFTGAYIYTLDLTNGFRLKAKITHADDNAAAQNSDDNVIKRIIYIGDYIYTISDGKVKAILRSDMSEKAKLEF